MIRKLFFVLVIVLINVFLLEFSLGYFFFHQKSGYKSSCRYYFDYFSHAFRKKQVLRNRIGLWKHDDLFGYSHITSLSSVHRDIEFEATYTIDDRGNRITPDPEHPKGRIVILGGSYTFGFGVNDQETYPYVLGKDYWREWKVENRGVNGWGTSHAFLAVREMLSDGDFPAMILYSMIPSHIERNYLRKSWISSLNMIPEVKRDHPRFEMEHGALVFKGVVNIEAGIDDSPDLRAREIELTNAFLKEMRSLCSQKEIPFHVVLLPQKNVPYWLSSWPPSVIRNVADGKTNLLDLTELRIEYIPNDSHPTASGHRKIAEQIALSPISASLESR